MGRSRTMQGPSDVSPGLFWTEIEPAPGSSSDSVRGGAGRKTLERMASAFRSLESFRTLAWMRIEDGKRKDAVETLQAWEEAVRATREDYEKLTH